MDFSPIIHCCVCLWIKNQRSKICGKEKTNCKSHPKFVGSPFDMNVCQFEVVGSCSDMNVCQFEVVGSPFDMNVCQFEVVGSLYDMNVCQFEVVGSCFDMNVCREKALPFLYLGTFVSFRSLEAVSIWTNVEKRHCLFSTACNLVIQFKYEVISGCSRLVLQPMQFTCFYKHIWRHVNYCSVYLFYTGKIYPS